MADGHSLQTHGAPETATGTSVWAAEFVICSHLSLLRTILAERLCLRCRIWTPF